jgi:hypothetical protein
MHGTDRKVELDNKNGEEKVDNLDHKLAGIYFVH